MLRQFAKWSDEVPLDAPWTAKRAKNWDSMTVATWINSAVKSATARKILAALMSGIYTSDPDEVSMLFALFHAKSCGGINAIFSAEIQSDRISGGAQLIPEKIAEKLGSSVHLNSPVKRIAQDAKNVVVSSDAVTVRTKSYRSRSAFDFIAYSLRTGTSDGPCNVGAKTASRDGG